MQLTNQIHSEP